MRLTRLLNAKGTPNVLSVRVDATGENSRWCVELHLQNHCCPLFLDYYIDFSLVTDASLSLERINCVVPTYCDAIVALLCLIITLDLSLNVSEC